ncbi:hypothetical protein [Streptomyces beijiangensis]|uniref:Uncharacterized protein n=1 Tax=Streptomyces beijiangensis TaxID=163361 RepID=A0A939F7U8_9ACTN|nr:hypothetical protein [Streptomyces beijiangensis]MBO0513940.1 hypothetical protein [Streptomyces beijiangensis]
MGRADHHERIPRIPLLAVIPDGDAAKDDVQPVNLQILDIPAAPQTKQVDSAVLTEPLRSKYLVPYAAGKAHICWTTHRT